MKIYCYLWLAFLLFCIFDGVIAWYLSPDNNNNNQGELRSFPDSEYVFVNDLYVDENTKRRRNERETDFYDTEDGGNYDTSNDFYPSLNLFSWWSSKNRGKESVLKNEAISTNSESNSESSVKQVNLLNSSKLLQLFAATNPTTALEQMYLQPVTAQSSSKEKKFYYRPYFSTSSITVVNSENINDNTSVNYGLNDFQHMDFTTEANIAFNMSESNVTSETLKPDTNNETGPQETYNSSNPDNFQPLSTSLSYLLPTIQAVVTEDNSAQYNSAPSTYLILKPTYQLITTGKTITNNSNSLNIDHSESNYSFNYKRLLNENPKLNILPTETALVLNKDENSLGNNVNSFPKIVKTALQNFTKRFMSNKEKSTIPFSFNIYKNPHILVTTSLPSIPVNFSSNSSGSSLEINQFGDSQLNNINDITNNTGVKEDPYKFLLPIPTIKYNSFNISKENNDLTIAEFKNAPFPITADNNKNNIELLQNISNNGVFDSKISPHVDHTNHTEMKYVIPEYFSGFAANNEIDSNDIIREKRTSKRTTIDKYKIPINKSLAKNSSSIESDVKSDLFLSKFKNLQKDLSDLQKVLSHQAKDCDGNKEKNLTVHVRVIVDVHNGTDEGDEKGLKCKNDKIASENCKSKDFISNRKRRSWLLFPNNSLPNQRQLLVDKILDQLALDELNEKTMNTENEENTVNENDELKVNLNFPSSLLKDDAILSSLNADVNEGKDSTFLLTTSQFDPSEKQIDNPIHKAIYSKYIAGQKYLVIPLLYLEEQNKSNNTKTFSILQPSSIDIKKLGNNSCNNPSDVIADCLAKDRQNNFSTSAPCSVFKDTLNNSKIFNKCTNQQQFSNGKSKSTTLFVGEPEMILEFLQKSNVKKDKSNKLYFEDSKFKSKKSDFVKSTNKFGLPFPNYSSGNKLNESDNNIGQMSRIKCVKYPIYTLINDDFKNKNNLKDIIVKNRRESKKCKSAHPFLFFTNSNYNLPTNLPLSETCRSNIAPLIRCQNCTEFNVERKPNVSVNLKTSKIDLYKNSYPFEKRNWGYVMNGDTKCDITQGSLLFANRLMNKRGELFNKGRRKRENSQRKKSRKNRLNSRKNVVKKKRHNKYMKLASKKEKTLKDNNPESINFNKNNEYSDDNTMTFWNDCNLEQKKEDKLLDESDKVPVSVEDIDESKQYHLNKTMTTVKVTKNFRGMIKNRLKGLGDQINAAIVSAALNSLTKGTVDSTKPMNDVTTIKVTTSHTDTEKNSDDQSCSTIKNCANDDDNSKTVSSDLCEDCQDICTGIPPTSVGQIRSTFRTTMLNKKTTTIGNTEVTPSEEEIEKACTECAIPICGGGGEGGGNRPKHPGGGGHGHDVDEHGHRPKGVQCHHHLKNHTTLEHHRMKDHQVTHEKNEGKPKKSKG